eukprot:3743927-Rhodomonas_salina.1
MKEACFCRAVIHSPPSSAVILSKESAMRFQISRGLSGCRMHISSVKISSIVAEQASESWD